MVALCVTGLGFGGGLRVVVGFAVGSTVAAPPRRLLCRALLVRVTKWWDVTIGYKYEGGGRLGARAARLVSVWPYCGLVYSLATAAARPPPIHIIIVTSSEMGVGSQTEWFGSQPNGFGSQTECFGSQTEWFRMRTESHICNPAPSGWLHHS